MREIEAFFDTPYKSVWLHRTGKEAGPTRFGVTLFGDLSEQGNGYGSTPDEAMEKAEADYARKYADPETARLTRVQALKDELAKLGVAA